MRAHKDAAALIHARKRRRRVPLCAFPEKRAVRVRCAILHYNMSGAGNSS
jgi:hypothetical protein